MGTELDDKRKDEYADEYKRLVLNPTSLSQRLFRDLYLNSTSKIMIGNFGIGKSFSLRNFQYLSSDRFKLLHDSLLNKAKEDYQKWLLINEPDLLSNRDS